MPAIVIAATLVANILLPLWYLVFEPAEAQPSEGIWQFDAVCVSKDQNRDAVHQQQKKSDKRQTKQACEKGRRTQPQLILRVRWVHEASGLLAVAGNLD